MFHTNPFYILIDIIVVHQFIYNFKESKLQVSAYYLVKVTHVSEFVSVSIVCLSNAGLTLICCYSVLNLFFFAEPFWQM